MTIKIRLIKTQIAAAVGAALLAPTFSDAATLGRMTVQSGRNEPLRAEIQVTQIDPREATSLSARIGSRAAHEKARIPYPEEASKLEASIARKPDGGYVVVLRSREMITEPMLDVLVELKSPLSEVARPYLIDTSTESSAQASGEAIRGDSATRPESLLRTEAIVRGDPLPPRLEASPGPSSAVTPAAVAPSVASTSPAAPVLSAPSGTPPAVGATMPSAIAPAIAPRVDASARGTGGPKAEATTRAAGPLPATRGAVPAATTASAPSSDSVAVAKGDTLATIAARTKADEVSLDRAMLAIFRANQQAFFGSIHQLKADQTLQIPSRETMLGEPDEFIARELRRHSEIFRNYKAQVAGSVPLASNQSTRPARDSAAAGSEKYDRLVLSKGASDLSTAEQRAAADTALREANSRISELQRNIKDLKRLADLKDRQIAEVSAQLKTLAVDRSTGSGSLRPTSTQASGSPGQSDSSGPAALGPAVLPSNLQPAVAATTTTGTTSGAGSTAPAVTASVASVAAGAGPSPESAKGEPKLALAPTATGNSPATAAGATTANTASPSPSASSGTTPTPAAPVPIKRVEAPAALRTEAESSIPSYWIYGGVALLVLLIGFLVRRSRQRKAAQAALEDDPHSLFGDSTDQDSRMPSPATTITGNSKEPKKPQVVPVN